MPSSGRYRPAGAEAALELYDRIERNCRNYERWAQGRRDGGKSQ